MIGVWFRTPLWWACPLMHACVCLCVLCGDPMLSWMHACVKSLLEPHSDSTHIWLHTHTNDSSCLPQAGACTWSQLCGRTYTVHTYMHTHKYAYTYNRLSASLSSWSTSSITILWCVAFVSALKATILLQGQTKLLHYLTLIRKKVFVYLSVCLFMRLSVCLSVSYSSVCLSVSVSVVWRVEQSFISHVLTSNNVAAYIHTYMHTYIHMCIHICIHTYLHICIHTYLHTYIYVCKYVCMYVCMHICMYVCCYIIWR